MVRIISIEGNIGSGKSTLVDYLKHFFSSNSKFVFLPEPVNQWEQIIDHHDGENIIVKFYKDQSKYSFAFQMMAYISRLSILRNTFKDLLQKEIDNPGSKYYIITERSLYTDRYVFAQMLYDDGLIDDVSFQIYLKWWDEFLDEITIHQYIYVYTVPEIAKQRVDSRSRDGEGSIDIDYLSKCHDYHERWLLNTTTPTMFINGNTDRHDEHGNIKYDTPFISSIQDFIYQK